MFLRQLGMDVDSSKSKHAARSKQVSLSEEYRTYQSPQQTLTTMPQMSPVMSLYENEKRALTAVDILSIYLIYPRSHYSAFCPAL